MPLLRKKVFEKHVESDFLRDDDEVFYCKITNEIFKDYHEFSERMFLCNSMVWTCSMTGKSDLTYLEAEESEKHAVESLKGFPNQLKLPILYLSTLTKRTSFGDMAEDIFVYIKDRYFVGENIEACFTSNKWKDCHIISVIAPDEEHYKHEVIPNGNESSSERQFIPSSNLFKYEIEHLDAYDNDISEIMIVDSTQLRRRRVDFTKDKLKLFLKQNVEQDSRGIFVIKSSMLDKYNIRNVMWETIFDGPLPCFHSSKHLDKMASKQKKQRQETMSKYLKKNGLTAKTETQGDKKNQLLEVMRKREENYKILKRQKLEARALQKQQQKEDGIKLALNFKDWSKPKEDLELEDHAKLPIPTPVQCTFSYRYFGDVLSILEFVHCFQKVLAPKDFFPGGLNLEILERALLKKEVAGPLADLIQMFLVAIFNCQEEESNSYNTRTEKLRAIKVENTSVTPSLQQSTYLATLASKWSNRYQGLPTSRLPLYPLTVSEVLRLHLLSSGARINDIGFKWRYAQRGGYTSEDDPGLHMRLNGCHILKALAVQNVVQLSIGDKLKIITCLMNQLSTYADVRDIIDENLDKERGLKQELKSLRAEERKRDLEFATHRAKLKKEMAGNPEGFKETLEQLAAEHERKHNEDKQKIDDLLKSLSEGQVLLGRDRAYRKYMKIEAVPGIFVIWEDELAGTCLARPTAQYPHLINAPRADLMAHVRNMTDQPPIKIEPTTKTENLQPDSPMKVNGITNSLPGTDVDSYADLLLCTTDPSNCPVHSKLSTRQKWSFFHDPKQIDELIEALNKRGYREGELKECLKSAYCAVVSVVCKTPVRFLNPHVEIKREPRQDDEKPVRVNGSSKKKDRYEDANLGYPTEMDSDEVLENALIENILEMEEKIISGYLGVVKTKDREKWRNCLQNKNYDEFEQIIKNHLSSTNGFKEKEQNEGESRASTPESSSKNQYQDPGNFLGPTVKLESEDSDTEDLDDKVLMQSESTKRAIHCLANALCHVAQAVDVKFLKKPLGHAGRTNTKAKEPYDVLDNWMQSLLASTSFSQIFLHYGTLDSCVLWSKSALLARCQICRRQRDSENMLLCDSCNMGHHMYCLKPKLTAVPQGDWFCNKCQKEKEKEQKLLSPEPAKKRRMIFIEDEEEGEDQASGDESESISDNEESVVKLELCKTCGSGGETVECEKCECHFHKECTEPPLRRLPRMPWTCSSCSARNKGRRHGRDRCSDNGFQSESSDDEVVNRRSFRRDDKRDDLPLHNAALQELLSDVMKHESAWPFLRPVQTKEVPDYYNIITEPMDFATLKYKLNMGKYSTDSQLMRDVVLIFENCNTYNSRTDEVYQCGKQLLEYFSKKASELGLVVPPELEFDVSKHQKIKKRRIK